jgi:hypothetical protein
VDNNLTMLSANNGNAMVVITTQQYCSKMQLLLSDLIYKPLQADQTQKVEQQTTWLIQSQHWIKI